MIQKRRGKPVIKKGGRKQLQRRKTGKERPMVGKPRKRNISRKNTDKNVKELLTGETISGATAYNRLG